MRKVIIIGGFGVLGQAVSKAFERQEHKVALIYRGPDHGEDTQTPSFGGFDLADPRSA